RLLDHSPRRCDAAFNLLDPVHPQRQHAFTDGLVTELLDRSPPQDHPAQLGRERHDLVYPLPPPVAGASTGVATSALHELDVVKIGAKRLNFIPGVARWGLAVGAD